jgi:lysophospholipase L1-like esterase
MIKLRFLMVIFILLGALCAAAQTTPYQRIKTPYEYEYLKGSKKVFVPDTTEALACNDTNRIAVVGQSVVISYRDIVSGCAKWFTLGDVSSYFSSFIRSQYLSKENKSFWAHRGRLDTMYMDGTIYTTPSQVTDAGFTKQRFFMLGYGINPFWLIQQDSIWTGSAWQESFSYGGGYRALYRNRGIHSNGWGYQAGNGNTGQYSNGFGYNSLFGNTGQYGTGYGSFSLYQNTAAYAVGIGGLALYQNTGANPTGVGYNVLRGNVGSGPTGMGVNTLNGNRGNSPTAMGVQSLQSNVGDSSTAYGSGSGYFNNWKKRTSIGTGAGFSFVEDPATVKSFASANINTGTQRVTITGHGYGTTGYINLRFKVVSGTPPTNIVNDGLYQFQIIDANTLQFSGFTTAGSGNFTLTRDLDRTNSIEIGANAQATKPDQVMIGDHLVKEVYTAGKIRANASDYSTGGYKVLVHNSTTKEFETISSDSIGGGSVSTPTVKILLPSNLYAVQGVESNIYFDNVIYSEVGIQNLEIDVTCTKGKHYERFWRYTPLSTDSGTVTFQLDVYYQGNLAATKTVNLNTTTTAAGSGNRNYIVFGDSQIDGGVMVDSIEINYAANPLNIVSQGYYTSANGNKHNGRGGHRYRDFATYGRAFYDFTVTGVTTPPSIDAVYSDGTRTYKIYKVAVSGTGVIQGEKGGTGEPPASGTLTRVSGTGDASISFTSNTIVSGNPMWNATTGTVEFSKYLTDNSITYNAGDWVFFHLGTNDIFGLTVNARVVDTAVAVKKYIDTLVASIRRVSPDINIGIGLPPIGSDQDGFGDDYSNSQNYRRYNRNMKLLHDYLLANVDVSGYRTNKVYVLSPNMNYDAVYNSFKGTMQVNAKNSATVQFSTNGVHPAPAGTSQMGDVYYALLKWFK